MTNHTILAEIFFHFSEAEGDIELRPGDDVEFTIQTRNVSHFQVSHFHNNKWFALHL